MACLDDRSSRCTRTYRALHAYVIAPARRLIPPARSPLGPCAVGSDVATLADVLFAASVPVVRVMSTIVISAGDAAWRGTR